MSKGPGVGASPEGKPLPRISPSGRQTAPAPRSSVRCAFLNGFAVGVLWGRLAVEYEAKATRLWLVIQKIEPASKRLPTIEDAMRVWRRFRRSQRTPEAT